MRRRVMLLLVGIVAFAAACGVPRSSEFTTIDPDDIPAQLLATTTTTSTTLPSTTTTLPSTTTTIELASTTTFIEATSTTSVATELVPLYFVAGRRLVRYEVALPRPAAVVTVLENLIRPPADVIATARTALPAESLIEPRDDRRGRVTVDLPADFFDDANFQDPGFDQRLVIAQIVLTLTELRGISQVRFTQEGQAIPVLLWDGTSTEPGQPLYHLDYVEALSSPPETTTTTTTTSPPEPTITTFGPPPT